MPHIIMRVTAAFDPNSHPSLTKLCSIGNVVLICHVPVEEYASLKADPNVSYLKVEKYLKRYFRNSFKEK
jgi:hypothetical protein